MSYLILEYSNEKDFAGILYQIGFTQRLYLDVDVGIPTYPQIEEGKEDGENNFNPTFQKLQKKYKFQFVCPEYILDALYLVKLHDNIFIQLKNNENSKVQTFDVSHVWSNEDGWAKTTVEFTIDYVTKTGYTENQIIALKPVSRRFEVTEVINTTDPIYTDPENNGVIDNENFVINKVDGQPGNTDIIDFKTQEGEFESITRIGTEDNDRDTSEGTAIKRDFWVEEASGDTFSYDAGNDLYKRFPAIESLTNDGLNVTIKGYALAGSYAQVWYREQAVGSFIKFGDAKFIEDFQDAGVTQAVLASKTYEFYFESYTHNEDLGNSPTQLIVIP